MLTGENDGISSVEECTAMAEELVDAELVVVPAAGHFTPIEAPDATTAALRSLFVRATG